MEVEAAMFLPHEPFMGHSVDVFSGQGIDAWQTGWRKDAVAPPGWEQTFHKKPGDTQHTRTETRTCPYSPTQSWDVFTHAHASNRHIDKYIYIYCLSVRHQESVSLCQLNKWIQVKAACDPSLISPVQFILSWNEVCVSLLMWTAVATPKVPFFQLARKVNCHPLFSGLMLKSSNRIK